MTRISFVWSFLLDLPELLDPECRLDGLRKLISFTFELTLDTMDISDGKWCRKNPGNVGRHPHITPTVNSTMLIMEVSMARLS